MENNDIYYKKYMKYKLKYINLLNNYQSNDTSESFDAAKVIDGGGVALKVAATFGPGLAKAALKVGAKVVGNAATSGKGVDMLANALQIKGETKELTKRVLKQAQKAAESPKGQMLKEQGKQVATQLATVAKSPEAKDFVNNATATAVDLVNSQEVQDMTKKVLSSNELTLLNALAATTAATAGVSVAATNTATSKNEQNNDQLLESIKKAIDKNDKLKGNLKEYLKNK